MTSYWLVNATEQQKKKTEFWQTELKNYLAISKEGVPLHNLNEVLDTDGVGQIPFSKLGYQHLNHFLFDCYDFLSLAKFNGKLFLFIKQGEIPPELANIVQLVKGQDRAKGSIKNPRPLRHQVNFVPIAEILYTSSYNDYARDYKPPPKHFGRRRRGGSSSSYRAPFSSSNRSHPFPSRSQSLSSSSRPPYCNFRADDSPIEDNDDLDRWDFGGRTSSSSFNKENDWEAGPTLSSSALSSIRPHPTFSHNSINTIPVVASSNINKQLSRSNTNCMEENTLRNPEFHSSTPVDDNRNKLGSGEITIPFKTLLSSNTTNITKSAPLVASAEIQKAPVKNHSNVPVEKVLRYPGENCISAVGKGTDSVDGNNLLTGSTLLQRTSATSPNAIRLRYTFPPSQTMKQPHNASFTGKVKRDPGEHMIPLFPPLMITAEDVVDVGKQSQTGLNVPKPNVIVPLPLRPIMNNVKVPIPHTQIISNMNNNISSTAIVSGPPPLPFVKGTYYSMKITNVDAQGYLYVKFANDDKVVKCRVKNLEIPYNMAPDLIQDPLAKAFSDPGGEGVKVICYNYTTDDNIPIVDLFQGYLGIYVDDFSQIVCRAMKKSLIPKCCSPLKVGEQFRAKVSHFDNSDIIYLQLEEDLEYVEKMDAVLETLRKNKLLKTGEVKPCDIVITTYENDGCLYRAKAMAYNSGMWSVCYIDYGNIGTEDVKTVYPAQPCDSSAALFPHLCLRVRVVKTHRAFPIYKDWDNESLFKFEIMKYENTATDGHIDVEVRVLSKTQVAQTQIETGGPEGVGVVKAPEVSSIPIPGHTNCTMPVVEKSPVPKLELSSIPLQQIHRTIPIVEKSTIIPKPELSSIPLQHTYRTMSVVEKPTVVPKPELSSIPLQHTYRTMSVVEKPTVVQKPRLSLIPLQHTYPTMPVVEKPTVVQKLVVPSILRQKEAQVQPTPSNEKSDKQAAYNVDELLQILYRKSATKPVPEIKNQIVKVDGVRIKTYVEDDNVFLPEDTPDSAPMVCNNSSEQRDSEVGKFPEAKRQVYATGNVIQCKVTEVFTRNNSQFTICDKDKMEKFEDLEREMQSFYSESDECTITDLTPGCYGVYIPDWKKWVRCYIRNYCSPTMTKLSVKLVDYPVHKAIFRKNLRLLTKRFYSLPQQGLRAKLAADCAATDEQLKEHALGKVVAFYITDILLDSATDVYILTLEFVNKVKWNKLFEGNK